MIRVNDHIGRSIELENSPQRIISLCPSITETLFALGLEKRIVGRTRFCIHPAEAVKPIMRVGGTKKLKMKRVHELIPDLIIAEKEENTPEMVAELAENYPVFVVNVEQVSDAFRMMDDLGKLTQTEATADSLKRQIQKGWDTVSALPSPLRVVYLIWQDPIMAVGRDTYIQSVLAHCGLKNLCLPLEGRYPALNREQLVALAPDLLLLSSEPYPFAETHIAQFQELLPQTRVMLVDGEMFSWYGSRMVEAGEYLRNWLRSLGEVSTSAK